MTVTLLVPGVIELIIYLQGQGVEKDLAQAKSLAETACNANAGLGCEILGELYKPGTGGDANEAKSIEYFARACALGMNERCPPQSAPSVPQSGPIP